MNVSDTPIEIGEHAFSAAEQMALDAFDSLIYEMEEWRKESVEYHGQQYSRMFANAVTNLQTARLWAKEAFETL